MSDEAVIRFKARSPARSAELAENARAFLVYHRVTPRLQKSDPATNALFSEIVITLSDPGVQAFLTGLGVAGGLAGGAAVAGLTIAHGGLKVTNEALAVLKQALEVAHALKTLLAPGEKVRIATEAGTVEVDQEGARIEATPSED